MKTISPRIQPPAVIILAFTSFLLLSTFQAFAQDASPASVPDDNNYTFSDDLNAETITFEAVNPGTHVAGRMTVTITGAYRENRLEDGQSTVGSRVQGDLRATFNFAPYYPNSPSYSASVELSQVAPDATGDSISFDFPLRATGSDGSVQWFMLQEVVTATEDGAQITFAQLELPDKFIAAR